jgi:hypothetical protein
MSAPPGAARPGSLAARTGRGRKIALLVGLIGAVLLLGIGGFQVWRVGNDKPPVNSAAGEGGGPDARQIEEAQAGEAPAGNTSIRTTPATAAARRPSESRSVSPGRSSSPISPSTTPTASSTSTSQCSQSGTLTYTAPNVPASVCISRSVTLDISPVDAPLTSSNYDVVQCSFYQAQSLGRCVMYGTGQATLQSTGTYKWTMTVVVIG